MISSCDMRVAKQQLVTEVLPTPIVDNEDVDMVSSSLKCASHAFVTDLVLVFNVCFNAIWTVIDMSVNDFNKWLKWLQSVHVLSHNYQRLAYYLALYLSPT